MRLYTPTLGARTPQNPNRVPFRELSPLALKNKIQNRKAMMNENNCLHEMTLLFSCMEKNGFIDIKCTSEIMTFQSCYENYISKMQEFKEQQAKGAMTPGSRNLTPMQTNKLLSRFPNPK